jgi:hypothetical protein
MSDQPTTPEPADPGPRVTTTFAIRCHAHGWLYRTGDALWLHRARMLCGQGTLRAIIVCDKGDYAHLLSHLAADPQAAAAELAEMRQLGAVEVDDHGLAMLSILVSGVDASVGIADSALVQVRCLVDLDEIDEYVHGQYLRLTAAAVQRGDMAEGRRLVTARKAFAARVTGVRRDRQRGLA